ncbi:MAG: ABC transporter ATP-binding protein/permease [Alphaproteobacteria bacterium]
MAANVTSATASGQPLRRMRSWRDFFRKFLRLAGPYWSSESKWRVRGLTAFLIALTVAQVAVPVALNLWSESLFDALAGRAMDRFLRLLGVLAVIIAANVVIVTTHLRVRRRLQIDWRDWLTRRLGGEWMAGGRHYRLTHIPGEHDNPDGRIAEDARITTEYAIDLAHSLLYCLLLLVSFTQILWSLSGPPQMELSGVHLYIPGHLVWVALVYAAIGTSVALLLGRPLVRATDRRQTFEANFRFGLVHARENSLAIALVQGEADERGYFLGLFRGAVDAWDGQTRALVNIFYYTTSWSVLSQVFPVLVAAPRYIIGAITLGVLMQTAQAFQQMIAALSWPVDNLSKLADWRASVERVLGLHEGVERLAEKTPSLEHEMIGVSAGSARALMLRALSVADPDGKPILTAFDAEIAPGERVLISGDPGAADKIFKAVAGLWPWGRGTVELPRNADIFFLPQKPYLPIGSLRHAIAYPTAPEPHGEEEFRAALERVGLGHLIPRLDDVGSWDQLLGMAEQQRLGFARLLLHRPSWIFIQEATDALDPESESDMMRLLQKEFPEATVITIGFHAGLEAYHRRKIVLERRNDEVVAREAGPARA